MFGDDSSSCSCWACGWYNVYCCSALLTAELQCKDCWFYYRMTVITVRCRSKSCWNCNKTIVDSRLRPRVHNSRWVIAGLYRWAKFGGNLIGCYVCRIVSPLTNALDAPQGHRVKTWRHPHNRKYVTYRNAARWGPSHDRWQHALKFGEVRPRVFQLKCEQTDGQTNRHSHLNT